MQAGLYSHFIDFAIDSRGNDVNGFPESMRGATSLAMEHRIGFALAQGFTHFAQKGKVLALFSRFHSETERRLCHAQDQLDKIR